MNSLRSSLSVYAATLVVFVMLDAAWLFFVAIGQFQSVLGPVLRPQPDFMAALALYPIYAGGLLLLAVAPAIRERSLTAAAMKGAVLGLTAHATFDLTSLAIIRGYTVGLAIIDIGWGTLLSSIAAVAGYLVGAPILRGQSR